MKNKIALSIVEKALISIFLILSLGIKFPGVEPQYKVKY